MKNMIVIVAALLISGCGALIAPMLPQMNSRDHSMSRGSRFKESNVAKLKEGKTTYTEATELLGMPYWSGPGQDNGIQATWQNTSSMTSEDGTMQKTSRLNLVFDKNKVLTSILRSGDSMGSVSQ